MGLFQEAIDQLIYPEEENPVKFILNLRLFQLPRQELVHD